MKHSTYGFCDNCGRLKKVRLYYIPGTSHEPKGKSTWLCRICRDNKLKEEKDVE